MHWRELANTIVADNSSILESPDEEYALYNFLFDCRAKFIEAVRARDSDTVTMILNFVSSCLENTLDSNGEDLSAAAGAAFAEHLFDDAEEHEWPIVYKSVGTEFYIMCRSWVKNWVSEDVFEKLESIHHETRA